MIHNIEGTNQTTGELADSLVIPSDVHEIRIRKGDPGWVVFLFDEANRELFTWMTTTDRGSLAGEEAIRAYVGDCPDEPEPGPFDGLPPFQPWRVMQRLDELESRLNRVPYADSPALAAIVDERAAQDAKWGTQRLTWPEWMSVLGEEYGEACQAANQAFWTSSVNEAAEKVAALRTELVQTAAVAVAIIEHIDELLAGESDGGE